MAKKYRVGAIGFAHSHIETNIKSFALLKDRVEMVAAADVPPRVPSLSIERGTRYDELKQAVRLYDMKEYDCYEKLLEENELDICCVCAENAYHPFVTELLLKKGIHVVLEKPFAADMKGTLRMWRAARASNAKIITNWPSAWSPGIRTAKELVDAGKIGRVFKFSHRNSDSQGPLSYGQTISEEELGAEWWYSSDQGGGSMLDYCCYGACMSCWFLGQRPVAAFGVKANINSHYGDAEDYAAIIARFPNAVVHLEGSWATVNSGVPAGPLIYGTEGTIVVGRSGVEVYKQRHTDKPDEVVEPKPLPAGRATLGEDVLNHLDTGEPLFPMIDLPLNLLAASILDAGARSAVSNKLELVGDEYWTIGKDPDLLIL
ncbi:MAG: Gfo/Idh/MocA family oxidoreductase [Oscillospiraceae bacterium]|nr:Gfo/Idh/MocA family oxidoreductase [Oscillospiraceae bacterium]